MAYTIKIADGVADPSVAEVGDLVTITAFDKSDVGKVFKQWVQVGTAITFTNAKSRVTTFTMPAQDVTIGAEFEDIPIVITVRNGSYSLLSATYGSTCTITATNRVKEGYIFKEWSVRSGDVVLADASKDTTTFQIGIQNVIVEALYNYIYYPITVGYGTPSQDKGHVGEEISVSAFDRSQEGKVFNKWVLEKGNTKFADYTSPNTTITFAASDIVGWASYTDIDRTISVTHGTASKPTGIKDDTITITATDRTPEGYYFTNWTVEKGGVALKDSTSEKTTFQVVLSDVEVTAHFDFIEYALKITNATASTGKTAHIGETVTLTADDKTASNLRFDHWEIHKGLITIADENVASFVMVPSEIEIEAVYVQKSKPIDQDNFTILQGRRDKIYGIVESKVSYSRYNTTAKDNSTKEMGFKWLTPEDGVQGASGRDTATHLIEGYMVISKNQSED